MFKRNGKRDWKIFCIIVVVLLVVVDRITKNIIKDNLGYGDRIVIIEDFFNITYHRNFGAAWGILQGALPFFIIVTVIMLTFSAFIFIQSKIKLLDIAITLIFTGALGNFIDRVSGKGVIDFLEFFIFGYAFPVFNAADIFITIGTAVLAVYLLFYQKDGDIKWNILKKKN